MARDAHAPSLEGSRLGRYRLRFRIAQGGMASVYLAQLEGSHGFERWVAVKVIHPHLTDERRFADMLFDEARVAARIHHPNVCAVLDFGEQDGVLFLVMEYLHGESFSSAIRRACKGGALMDPWLAARVTLDAAMGLHAAHALTDQDGQSLGVVHRDVSPQNIQVLYEGQSKVVDFGIARAKGRITSTDVGEVKGKLSYMAPEQVRSSAIDHRADVWALGVVLWEATVGRRLFRTDNHATTVMNVVQMEIPPPSSLIADYPPALERAVMGALTRDPAARTPSAGLLGEQLEEFIYSLGRPAGPRQVARWMRATFSDKLSQREAVLGDARGKTTGPVPDLDLASEPSATSHVRGSAGAALKRVPPPRPMPPDPSPVTAEPVTAPIAAEAPSAPSAVEVADTQSDIALPEARAGLAIAPESEPLGRSADDDDGATVVADPPTGMDWDLIAGLKRPSPPVGTAEAMASPFDDQTAPGKNPLFAPPSSPPPSTDALSEPGGPPAPPIVSPAGRKTRPLEALLSEADLRRLMIVGAAIGVTTLVLVALVLLIL